MTLVELIAKLQEVLAEHPEIADRDVLDDEGGYTCVQVSYTLSSDGVREKSLMVG